MKTKEINGFTHIRHETLGYDQATSQQRAREFYHFMDKRRTVREISDRVVPEDVIRDIIMTASTAPSGAHKQPWTFCVIADHKLKSRIREVAEKEEYESYHGRMSDRWMKDLAPLGTDWHKPFLTKAPWLVVVFKKVYEKTGDEKANNYYVNESVGIACGFLISAIHHAGLVTLPHTPSPMNFLSNILKRPENERPFLLLPVGYPEDEVYVPDLKRKPLEDVAVFY